MTLHEVHRDDFLTWKNLDVTKAFMGFLEETIAELSEDLSAGITLGDPNSAAIKTAQLVGTIQGLKYSLAVRIQDEEISPND